MQAKSTRRTLFLIVLPVVATILAWLALMAPLAANLLTPSLQVGQVAPQDILAADAAAYESQVLTSQRREAAARSVTPVYSRPDASVARQQLERLRATLAYIMNVRADSYASNQQKISDLAALQDLDLSQEISTQILSLSDARWQAVQQEAIRVLEEVMRGAIRPETMEDARSRVVDHVSYSLSIEQAEIVPELVAPFVAANSVYSESLTEAARQKARAEVEAVTVNFIAGEQVVQRGQVLDESDIEALQHLGYAQPAPRWQDPASAALLAILLSAFVILYLRRRPRFTANTRSLTLVVFLFLAFLFAARFTIFGHVVLPYAFPLAGYGLIVAAMFGTELALMTALPLALMAAFGMPNVVDLTLYYLAQSFLGVLVLGRAHRLVSFFWAGGAIALAGIMALLVYYLPRPTMDLLGLATLIGAAVFSGAAAATLTLILQFFLAQALGLTTPMQLMDLTRPDHPLLQLLLREAPGTYQHSLQVANLAEQAAERIGVDTLMTRVGALYHDIGKVKNPIFFIENQAPGFPNPHDNLDPFESSAVIVQHVIDGLDLARRHRLPRRIADFIAEHHGTMTTRYQYIKAVEAAGGDEDQVDKEQFRYEGPRPQSRETAILMLADGSEAAVRAERPTNEEELQDIVRRVIESRVTAGQLDDTELTLRNLDAIAKSFTATLRGIYHPRVKYPELEKKQAPAAIDVTLKASKEKLADENQPPEVSLGGSVEPTRPIS
ncbi:MAG TPA: HDIG domain-containing protein [Anaerolineales bacterium]|nr:HDIG domain-containing protein [Anaerolineales bacterium]